MRRLRLLPGLVCLSAVTLGATCGGVSPPMVDPTTAVPVEPIPSQLTLRPKISLPIEAVLRDLRASDPAPLIVQAVSRDLARVGGSATAGQSTFTAVGSSDGGTLNVTLTGTGPVTVSLGSVHGTLTWSAVLTLSSSWKWAMTDGGTPDLQLERSVVADGSVALADLGGTIQVLNRTIPIAPQHLAPLRQLINNALGPINTDFRRTVQAAGPRLEAQVDDARARILAAVARGASRQLLVPTAELPISVACERAQLGPIEFDTTTWTMRAPVGLKVLAQFAEPDERFLDGGPLPLQLADELPATTPLHVRGSVPISLRDLGYNARRSLRGKEFGPDEHHVKVTDVKVSRRSAREVVVTLECEGDYAGPLFLVGAPVFDVTEEWLAVPALSWDSASEVHLRERLPWLRSEDLRSNLAAGVHKGSPVDLERARSLAIGREFLGLRVADAGFAPLPSMVLEDTVVVNTDFDVSLEEIP